MSRMLFVIFVCVVVIDIGYRVVKVAERGPSLQSSAPTFAPAPKPYKMSPEVQRQIEEFRMLHDERLGPLPHVWPWQERAADADDFAALVHVALPEAERGNGDAQFALYNLFVYCRDALRERASPELRRVPEVASRETHEHCDRLARENPDLDAEAARWLGRSLESKFPRALAYAASEDIAAMSRKPPGKAERERRIAQAREKLLYALKTNDPSVTSTAAAMLPALFAEDPRAEQAAWVWRLAACEQGLDCTPESAFVLDDCRRRNLCRAGESQQDYIRRASGDPPALLARARTLAVALRKGQIDDASFDEVVTSSKLPVARTVEKRAPTRLLQ